MKIEHEKVIEIRTHGVKDETFGKFKNFLKGISLDETRFVLMDMLVTKEVMVVTDGSRLYKIGNFYDIPAGLWRPRKLSNNVIMLFQDKSEITYPNWQAIIPAQDTYHKLCEGYYKFVEGAMMRLGEKSICVSYKRLSETLDVVSHADIFIADKNPDTSTIYIVSKSDDFEAVLMPMRATE